MSDDSPATSPKVFISYSWTTPEHVKRVVELAERLCGDGVDVILDRWHLREGHDKYAFMEQMVTNPDVKKVVVLSDRRYAERANGREGGVGTETQIISQEIYNRVTQDKFIPVVLEVDDNEKPLLPRFLNALMYIDFSTPQASAENYERLLRAIYNRPELQRPPIGTPPAFLFETTSRYSSNRTYLDTFMRALHEDKPSSVAHARTYLERFLEGLEVFRVNCPTEQIDDEFDKVVHNMIKPRDELIEFYTQAFSFRDDTALLQIVMEYLESSLRYTCRPEGAHQWNEEYSDHYSFFNYECFIYLAAILIKYRRDSLLNELLSHEYYGPSGREVTRLSLGSFTRFWGYSRVLQVRNQRLQQRRLSPTADLVKDRATLREVPFEDLIQAEVILFTRSVIAPSGRRWFPNTIYFAPYSRPLPLFARAGSDQGCARISTLFMGLSKAELKRRLDDAINDTQKPLLGQLSWESDVDFESLINYSGIFNTQSPQ